MASLPVPSLPSQCPNLFKFPKPFSKKEAYLWGLSWAWINLLATQESSGVFRYLTFIFFVRLNYSWAMRKLSYFISLIIFHFPSFYHTLKLFLSNSVLFHFIALLCLFNSNEASFSIAQCKEFHAVSDSYSLLFLCFVYAWLNRIQNL